LNNVIYKDNLFILDIEADTPRKRGQIHGEALRGAIGIGLDRWKSTISGLGLDPEKMISHFVNETDYQSAIEKWTPDLLQEVKGLAEASGQDFNTIYTYQLMDDFFGYVLKNLPGPHCTSIGIAGNDNRSAIISQNQDMPVCYNGTQTVIRMHYKETGLRTLIFTLAGNIGQNIANNHGLGLAINTLGFLENSAVGLPSMFIVRRIGEQKSLADVESFLNTVTHSAGMNYMVGVGKQVADFEVCLETVKRYEGSSAGRYICHTNHPFVNKNLQTEYVGKMNDAFIDDTFMNSASRLKKAEEIMAGGPAVYNSSYLKKLYKQKPVCLRGDLGETVASIIFELGDNPVLHIAPGCPDTTEFQSIKLIN